MAHTKKATAESTPTQLFEVLTRAPNGHRCVHRVRAVNEAAAVLAVQALLDHPGGEVVSSAPAGQGLGSGD